ncbi:hypothetical protein GALMADRAFT_775072 [Galerina marginata CBS 339.88]|uniref:HMG box domain-containing protein n=1 Tax=Galerina marginata (strain CBS 339.88) TaxID=685588 RepID=A0A067SMH4_GALM3|nr:hypothetical protein GALMADRAFT_775072 [Galerina marginata CBS 339.88]
MPPSRNQESRAALQSISGRNIGSNTHSKNNEIEEDILEPHIPRPPNAFILFRTYFVKNRRVGCQTDTQSQTLSKAAGVAWKQLEEKQAYWNGQADIVGKLHKRKYPDYKYRPNYDKNKWARPLVAFRLTRRTTLPFATRRSTQVGRLSNVTVRPPLLGPLIFRP